MSRHQAALRADPRVPARALLRSVALGTALLGAAAGLAWGSEWLADPHTLPIRQVDVSGQLHHVSREALRAAVGPSAARGFLGADVRAIQARVEELPWVERASVRRVWPDRIVVEVQEQRPIARWQAGGLINAGGERFAADGTDPAFAALPLLQAPPEAADQAVRLLRGVSARLQPLGLGVAALRLDARGALRIALDNGVELVLGRAETAARLQRFLEVYPQVLAAQASRIADIDLRYGNGFAVRWKDGGAEG